MTMQTKKAIFASFLGDIDAILKQAYGLKYEAWLEVSNDTYHYIIVSGKIENYEEEDLKKEIARMVKGDDRGEYSKSPISDYAFPTIMNDLARKKLIKPGHYIINMCW